MTGGGCGGKSREGYLYIGGEGEPTREDRAVGPNLAPGETRGLTISPAPLLRPERPKQIQGLSLGLPGLGYLEARAKARVKRRHNAGVSPLRRAIGLRGYGHDAFFGAGNTKRGWGERRWDW